MIETIQSYFQAAAEKAFAKGWKSALLAVAQYWNDEADDAVHDRFIVSKRATPRWPHRGCWEDGERVDGESCTSCERKELDGLPYFDNGESAIAAIAPYCFESGSQDRNSEYNYAPLWVLRAGEPIERVGELERPWPRPLTAFAPPKVSDRVRKLLALVYERPLDDGPRHVLADALVEEGDPRGEAIATRGQAPSAELRRAWIGPLGAAIPDELAEVDGGFVRAATVFLKTEWFTDSDEWATVEQIRFAPGSVISVSPTMTGLRDVEVLDGSALDEMAHAKRPWAIESMAVRIYDGSDLAVIDPRLFPSLRKLRVIAPSGTRITPPAQLAELEVIGNGDDGGHVLRCAQLLAQGVAPVVRCSWLRGFGLPRPASEDEDVDPDNDVPAPHHDRAGGFHVDLRDGLATIGLDAFDPHAGRAALRALGAAIPREFKIELRASRLFTPLAIDVEAAQAGAGREVTVR